MLSTDGQEHLESIALSLLRGPPPPKSQEVVAEVGLGLQAAGGQGAGPPPVGRLQPVVAGLVEKA